MLEPLASYTPFLVTIGGLLLLFLVWRCASLLRELNDARMIRLINYLERADASKRAALDAYVTGIDKRLDRIERIADYTARTSHVLAAHFVPRLKTREDLEAEHRHEEDRLGGLDVESEFFRQLAEEEERRKRGNEVPPGWRQVSIKSLKEGDA